ncbi:hypothetical protein [Sphingobacterium tabacisoli]|uniref:DUF4843 domain-containing protein n=1 Tax=Sphingobacterium tabacisoli TaxID=2044855 RepID=A0ABW5L034_9SPHI|nr:hypothetical protein [Sphingobacterium tabacisoli]
MKSLQIFTLLLTGLFFTACNKDEAVPYDHPFFYIHVNNSDEVRIAADRNETQSYSVYFSGKKQFETMTLDYEIIMGNGLQEGRDFELLSSSRTLEFKPGIVEMPIQIRWLPHAIASEKNNNLTIRLISNNKNYTIGLPGPDRLQSSLHFIKF